MESIKFIWRKNKAETNLRRHKVSFEEAQTVFYDPNARMIFDSDHSDEEDRFVMLGFSSSFRILVVIHCYREEDTVIRIISARKANKNEQRQYERYML